MSGTRKVIAVLGAGPGLGMSMARRFGREGFAVALVSRSATRHDGYRAELGAIGVEARSYVADVTDADQVRGVLARIATELGEIDTVYSGPASPDALGSLVPLPDADGAAVRVPFESVVVPAADLVAAVLPPLLARGGGALFFAGGLSGVLPMPMLGALAPAAAALRMYVLTLHAALRERGVHAGILTIGGLIERGDIHQAFAARGGPLPGTLDPDEIAAAAWSMYVERDRAEATFDVLTPAA
ncbi:SDR family NAD(P)-dependent oxidoreductase [Pseudonocardia kunmingensis]|uniref:Short-subunit dehydrogenase n=1 Tax=Pseudonocardia kunmingensis TaxID=630975 RepID=A0A543E135_9PSEU|nr:SDR family NAD(P)-dependent oxidoreductase [Pseudonocardia kunmingensis]TQM15296.1 short-subunit dehydrogenase [Pseudonocardia kunmingensis]